VQHRQISPELLILVATFTKLTQRFPALASIAGLSGSGKSGNRTASIGNQGGAE
jgi:hypothetical protein